MNNWIKHPLNIEGENVRLTALEHSHLNELLLLAQDRRIWEFFTFDGTDKFRLLAIYNNFLAEREKGNYYPFIIIDKSMQKIIGSTCFIDIQKQHKKLEIGATWLHPDYWGTAMNTECKMLLLKYSFELLGAVRVQLKTDENNIRSRKAIEKIGAAFEGILRNEMIRDNGTNRNSAFYSIIAEEWNQRKLTLLELLK